MDKTLTPQNKNNSTENSNESTSGQPPVKNKGGRPPGSKNTNTLLQEAAINGVMTEVLKDFDKIVKTTIKKAEEGDTVCLKILWDRVVPARKAVEHIQQPGSQGITIVVQGTNPRVTEEIEDADYETIGEENG